MASAAAASVLGLGKRLTRSLYYNGGVVCCRHILHFQLYDGISEFARGEGVRRKAASVSVLESQYTPNRPAVFVLA